MHNPNFPALPNAALTTLPKVVTQSEEETVEPEPSGERHARGAEEREESPRR